MSEEKQRIVNSYIEKHVLPIVTPSVMSAIDPEDFQQVVVGKITLKYLVEILKDIYTNDFEISDIQTMTDYIKSEVGQKSVLAAAKIQPLLMERVESEAFVNDVKEEMGKTLSRELTRDLLNG